MLKNREEVVEMLAKVIRELDVERNPFQVDVYLYVDEDGNGTIDTFSNPGGNSWRNDDHYTIYSEPEHFQGRKEILYEYETYELANVLGISEEGLISFTASYRGYVDKTLVDGFDIREYIGEHESMMQKVLDDWSEYVKHETYYDETAELAVSNYEEREKLLKE